MVSLVVFGLVFFLSLFAEFLANDKPILIRYDGAFYSPIFRDYPETTFGGDLPTNAVYTDIEVQHLIEAKGWMLWPLIPYRYDTRASGEQATSLALLPPSLKHPLGTDDQARDVLARVIYGFRISVLFGFTLTVLSSMVGIAAGAVQGYFGGWIDLGFQRFLEVWSSLPTLYLLIILASLVQPGFWILLAIMLLFSWTAPGGLCAGGIPARAQFRLCPRRPRARHAGRAHHDAAHPAQRHDRRPHLPALHPGRLRDHADRARLPGLRPAAGLAVAGRAAAAGQEQPQCAVARLHRLHRDRGA